MGDSEVELTDTNAKKHDDGIETPDLMGYYISQGIDSPALIRYYVSYIEKQTRTRRLFSMPQIFCFTLMYFATWTGMGSGMYYALLNGGPAAFFFNFLLALLGTLAQAASMGELASVLPLAGAQYYWTFHFAPPSYRRILTWYSGWATWLGYVASLAGVMNELSFRLEASARLNFDYEVCNVWLFRWVPWLEIFLGVLYVSFFLVTVVVLWILSPKKSPAFIFTKTKFSGWNSDFVSWNVGMLTQVWCFVGFESVVHMGEDTKNPRRSAPRAMLWSIMANGLMGTIITITTPVEDVIEATYPFFYVIETSTGSRSITTVVAVGACFISFGCSMSIFASTTRITWAWARDGGLPLFFCHVDGSKRVPARAVFLTGVICSCLALLNLNSSAYIAFGAVTSLCSLALYFSYAIVLSVTLLARLRPGKTGTGRLANSEWSIGPASIPVNIFALFYTCYVSIWLPFPADVPVTVKTMNYCAPVFVTVFLGVTTAWFLWARDNWVGPNQAVVDYILRNEKKELGSGKP